MNRFHTLGLFILSSLLLTGTITSQAGISVEPYLGYSHFRWSTGGYSDSKTGAILGGKGGIELSKKTFVGLDFHLGGPYHLDTSDNSNEFMNSMWGAGIRWGSPNARLWIGYYPTNILNDVNANTQYLGNALKATIGVQFQTKLCFNLELIKQDFNQIKGSDLGDQSFHLAVEIFIFSISAPIEIK